MILLSVIGLALVVLALVIIHTQRMAVAILALAGSSALTAALLYGLDATTAGIIELSVGAGLVAVLFTFANSLLGRAADGTHPPIPRVIAAALAVLVFTLTASLTVIALVDTGAPPGDTTPFTEVFWQVRQADVLAQLALIFAASVGVLGLLAEPGRGGDQAEAESTEATHENEALIETETGAGHERDDALIPDRISPAGDRMVRADGDSQPATDHHGAADHG